MEWKTGTPDHAGTYLVTTEYAMMVDAHYGPHSYARSVEIDYFDGVEWNTYDRVLAWIPFDTPAPYMGD